MFLTSFLSIELCYITDLKFISEVKSRSEKYRTADLSIGVTQNKSHVARSEYRTERLISRRLANRRLLVL